MIVALSLLAAPWLSAQGPTVAASQTAATPCTRQSCKLEIRRGSFFMVIGRADDSLAPRVGLTGASVVRAVAGVPDAEEEARLGRRQLLRSNRAGIISVVVFSAGLISLARSDDAIFLSLASLPIGAASGLVFDRQRKKSVKSFDRAVWLYNRNLSNPLMPPPPIPRKPADR